MTLRSTRDQDGSGTVLALTVIILLVTVGLVATSATGAVVAQRRVQTAADLAALAGARAAQQGRDPCPAAAAIARRNGATTATCSSDGSDVLVTTTVTARLLPGTRTLQARARAGPAAVG
ncbi:MAG TPA: Rv3654c family TadE-like protein [Marmoricola sp.]|jgi:secretion/DNA translocation related TadE-like protein|nr:Rv3654c family TadE-like protein [Marmoricola sp.]